MLKPIRKLESHQVFSRLVTKTSGWLGLSKRGKVSLWRIGERDVGFYDRYIAVTRRASLAGCKLDEEFSTLAKIQRDIGLLIFVPTKYRVYHSLLPNAEQTSLPNLQLQYLAAIAKELEVPFLDLTPALEEHSRSLLAQDRYTFWRDDTHWSPTGMKLAAREIANALRARRRIRESGPAGLQ